MLTAKMFDRLLVATLFSIGWLAFMGIEAFFGQGIDMTGDNVIVIWIAYMSAVGALSGPLISQGTKEYRTYFVYLLIAVVIMALIRVISLENNIIELGSESIICVALFIIGYLFAITAEYYRRKQHTRS
jgi:hypothetical protein